MPLAREIREWGQLIGSKVALASNMHRLSAIHSDDGNVEDQSYEVISPLAVASSPSSSGNPSKRKRKANRHYGRLLNPNNNNESILYTNLGGLIMHLPGLNVKWAYEDWPEYLESLLGAACEGAFLLLLAARVYHYGHRVYYYLSSSPSGHYHNMLIKSYIIMTAIVLPVSFFSFIINAIVGDATFRVMSGNETPSPGVLQAGFSEAKAHIMAQLISEPIRLPMRIVGTVLCFAGSVWAYLYPTLRLRKYSGKNRNNNPVGNRRGAALGRRLIGVGVLMQYLNFLGWYTPVLDAYNALSSHSAVDANQAVGGRRNTARISKTMRTQNSPAASTMNVIYIQHESLSGSIMLNTDEGVRATPFFHDKMQNDTDFYVFGSTRAVSGNTSKL